MIDFENSLILPAEDDRSGATQRGGALLQELPEWKKAISGGYKVSYGKKEQRSILEQRQSLPIYKLKDPLVKVHKLVPRFLASGVHPLHCVSLLHSLRC